MNLNRIHPAVYVLLTVVTVAAVLLLTGLASWGLRIN